MAAIMFVPACLSATALADLTASPGGHYVRYDGKTIALVGDSGTQCVLQNLNIDYRQWIDDCHARGIPAVHIWSLVPPRQKQDGSVIEARYGYVYPGATPWLRRGPGGRQATDQLPQWDLTQFDEGTDPTKHYWPRLRDLCAYAKSKDTIVGITVFFGWPKHNHPDRPDWAYHPLNVVNGGFLSSTERITTVCQQIASPGTAVLDEPWSDAWPAPRKTQWVWERFGDKLIRETAQQGNVFFVFMDEHSYSEGNCGDHFARFFRRRGAVWTDWDRRRDEVDLVFSGTFSGDDKNADAVRGFAGRPARPYLHLEGGPYQGHGMRTAMWTFLIGGGHYFLHNDAGQETVTTGIMGYDPHVAGGDKAMLRRDWLGHAARFFNEGITRLDQMAPQNELVVSGAAYCLACPEREYAVYSTSGRELVLDLSGAPNTSFACRFYDPRSGRYGTAFPCTGGAQRAFEKPDEGDWALLVQAR
ncbi:MAG: putative collagen-binding domain-containing protein [Armatimonadota bacterium]